MQLSLAEVEHIADLAKLELTEEEKLAFQRQLSSVLEYVGKLGQVDTKGVEPMSHAIEVHNALRDDAVTPCPPDVRDAAIAAFPDRDGDQLRVKAVFPS